MIDSLFRNVRDAVDVLKRARSVREAARAFVPNRFLDRHVLNARPPDDLAAVDATATARALKELHNALKAEGIDESGKVDYAALRGSELHRRLDESSRLLHVVHAEGIESDDERIALWINLYNVLAIHGVLALDIRESVMEVPTYFSTVSYRVGDHTLSLDEIENGVLRANSPHPATRRRHFRAKDPRLALCPSRIDPRIHAALVCSSTSCPPVGFYDPEFLDAQLDMAAANYVANDVEVDDDARRISMPITFHYYRSDFSEGAAAFCIGHACGEHERRLSRAFGAEYAVDYRRYDWSLNAA